MGSRQDNSQNVVRAVLAQQAHTNLPTNVSCSSLPASARALAADGSKMFTPLPKYGDFVNEIRKIYAQVPTQDCTLQTSHTQYNSFCIVQTKAKLVKELEKTRD